jgi:hypothetical protein
LALARERAYLPTYLPTYPADEAGIEANEAVISDFLVDFALHCSAGKVHVIAHNMGNCDLLRSLQRIATNAQTRGKIKFDQIFLAHRTWMAIYFWTWRACTRNTACALRVIT